MDMIPPPESPDNPLSPEETLHVNAALVQKINGLVSCIQDRDTLPACLNPDNTPPFPLAITSPLTTRWLEMVEHELHAQLERTNPLAAAFLAGDVEPCVDQAEDLQAEGRARLDDQLPWSDYTNALELVRTHGQDLHYCEPWKAWLIYTGRHWARDYEGAVMRRAKHAVKLMARHIEGLEFDVQARALLTHVKRSLSAGSLRAMLFLAQSEVGIPVLPDDLDRDPWLLNCRNGTLDLREGTLRPHERKDLMTKCLPVEYDAEARCPTWVNFLERILASDADLITFVHLAIGYALTGDTREQCLFLLHGSGSNGKTTFLETLKALLGDYALATPSASLLARDRDSGIPNDIARLKGARLVTASEIGEGRRLNEELVKRLTGQETLSGRFLYAELFDFLPAFKLFVACNHLPTIRGTDHAIWRRIRLIPFTVTIPEAEQDRGLQDKLKAELPGILAWAVRGCLSWQRDGLLTAPKSVIAATADYRANMDVLGGWLTECCLVGPSYRTETTALYDAYKHWCDQQREAVPTLRRFGQELTERQYPAQPSHGKNWRVGLGLRSTT